MGSRLRNVKYWCLLVALIPVGAVPVNAAGWHTEVVDPSVAGTYSSLGIDSRGNGHVSYIDEALHKLKYGYWDHKLDKWFTTVLDSSSGFCSLALDSEDRPHISYQEWGTGRIKYAHWDGKAWQKLTLLIQAKNISFYTGITLNSQDHPRLSFYEYWGAGEDYELHLRTVAWTGARWEVQTIDPTPGSGKFNFLVSDSRGRPRVAYTNVKAENESLRYASLDGTSWNIDVIEGVDRPFEVRSVALALDKDDNPHIVYTDAENNLVKYATKRDGKWRISVVDALKAAGYPDRYGIAIDEKGVPYVSYYDAGLGLLKVAHLEEGRWVSEVVEDDFAGFTSSMRIRQGNIYLTFRDDTTQQLKFAFRPLADDGLSADATASAPKK